MRKTYKAARRKYPPRIRLVPTLQRGNSSGNAPALRDAGASLSARCTRHITDKDDQYE